MPLQPNDQVRLLLGERIPVGGSDADTFFTDEEIEDLLARASESTNGAAYLGWEAKAAEFAQQIDRDESGSARRMSQLYGQARKQADNYKTLWEAETAAVGARRVVGVPVAWARGQRLPRILYATGTKRAWTPDGYVLEIEGPSCD